MKIAIRTLIVIFILSIFFVIDFSKNTAQSWGFYGHKKINRHAVFILPPEMFGFYKKHIEYIIEHGTDPDKRTFADPKEAVRHYIDVENYADGNFDSIPLFWKAAVKKFSEDTLNTHGLNPWHIQLMMMRLTDAFKEENVDRILFVSANIGHYIADACVPLHTTKFYNGRRVDQKGIHAFWESRIPELFGDEWDYFVGRAEYVRNPGRLAFQLVKESHHCIDSIYQVYDSLNIAFPDDVKYTIEPRGQMTMKVISKQYAETFHKLLDNQVERRMQRAVKAVGSLWYTAWVNAGQPDLKRLENKEVSDSLNKAKDELDKLWQTGKPLGRPNPEDED